jgi:hypothetical protein
MSVLGLKQEALVTMAKHARQMM